MLLLPLGHCNIVTDSSEVPGEVPGEAPGEAPSEAPSEVQQDGDKSRSCCC